MVALAPSRGAGAGWWSGHCAVLARGPQPPPAQHNPPRCDAPPLRPRSPRPCPAVAAPPSPPRPPHRPWMFRPSLSTASPTRSSASTSCAPPSSGTASCGERSALRAPGERPRGAPGSSSEGPVLTLRALAFLVMGFRRGRRRVATACPPGRWGVPHRGAAWTRAAAGAASNLHLPAAAVLELLRFRHCLCRFMERYAEDKGLGFQKS